MIGVVTLCEGNTYVEKCSRMIDSIKQNTEYPVHVYTSTTPVQNADRVIDIKEFSDAPFRIQAAFNYNLKGIIINHFFNNTDYEKIVYLDCDIVINKPSKAFENEMNDYDFWGNVSSFSEEHTKLQSGQKFEDVIRRLNIKNIDILKAKYVTETIIVFNRTEKTKRILQNWADICEQVSKTNITPAYECVELGIAIQQVEDAKFGLLGKTSLANDIFETEHREKFIPIVRKK